MDSKETKIQNCTFLRTSGGFNYYAPKSLVHVDDQENQIKIYHIGEPNDLQTKTILLLGETGAGKTRQLNSLYNHLCAVDFEDPYRFEVIDEVGSEDKKDYDSQTECITGYLFHYEPGMRYKYNVLIIDTPGMADTRGINKQTEIVRQMEVFLKDKKFGIIDLHCLAFVVKASMNRRLEYFGEILQQCLRLFGKNTTTITQVMATHAVDKMKRVQDLLKTWGVNAESVYNFDNGPLYEPNKPGVINSDGDITSEEDINDIKRRWGKRAKECDAFFQLLFRIPSVSLRLTREALREKAYLEHAKVNLTKHICNALSCILANKDNLNALREFEMNMKENRSWKGIENVMEKTKVPVSEECGFFQMLFGAHIHNCPKCEKSCSDICHLFVTCPSRDSSCDVCGCLGKYHIKDDEIIKEKWVQKEVTDTDMKAKFENASNKKNWLEEQMDYLQDQEEKHRRNISKMIALVRIQTKRLSEISTVPIRQSPKEFMAEIMQELFRENPRFSRNLDEDYLNEFIESVLEEANSHNINEATWKQELDKLLNESDSAWNKTVEVLGKVANSIKSK